jgi:hypothetical protein
MIETLIGFAVLFGAFVLLPLFLLKLFFHLAFALIALPFKVIGAAFKVAFVVLGGLAKVLVGGMGLLLAVGLGLMLIVALPLLPLILLGGFVWAIFKVFTPKAAVVSV